MASFQSTEVSKKPEHFKLPVLGDLTTLTQNTNFAVLCALFLGLCSPAAVMAYSYDEIVLMVQAEQKVFGKADYASSLDQRLTALETKVFGSAHSGSDSSRLSAVCRGLGLANKTAVRTAVSPANVISGRKISSLVGISAEAKLAANKVNLALKSNTASKASMTSKANAASKVSVSGRNTIVARGNFAAKNTVSLAFPTKIRAPKHANLVRTKSVNIAAVPATQASRPSIDSNPNVASPAVQEQANQSSWSAAVSQTATAQAGTTKSEPGFLGLLVFGGFGLIFVCMGTVLVLLFRVKNEVHAPYNNDWSDSEFESVEELLSPFVADAAPIVFVDESLSQAPSSTVQIVDNSAMQPPLTRGQPVGDVSGYIELGQTMAFEPQAHSLDEQSISSASTTPSVQHEFSNEWEASLSKTYFYDLADIPNSILLGASDADYAFTETPSIEESLYIAENESLEAWPSYESPIAPKVITVEMWAGRNESVPYKELEGEVTLKLPGSTDVAADELICASTDSFDSNCVIEDFSVSAMEDETYYRAFAQLLLDAAAQTAEPSPLTSIPIYGKRTVAARLASGRHGSAEMEDCLRTLFSEAS